MNFEVPSEILEKVRKTLGTKSEVLIARAPGRINLIGEHTDYNNGLVLPGAIDKYMYFACKPNGSDTISATALDLAESAKVNIDELEESEHLWMNFLIGILLEFKKRGVELKGFNCAFSSDVPIGAGMSSSAALECAILVGLKNLFGIEELDNWDLINMSKSSNHNFLGIKGGVMDQFASLFGKKDNVMLLDCATSKHDYVQLSGSEYTWLLINTCVKHNHLTSGYNDRVRECQQAIEDIRKVFAEINFLSDIKETSQLATVSFESETVMKRAYFVINENARVRSFVKALNNNEWVSCGELLYASHKGLAEGYEVSCEELDFLVTLLQDEDGVLGSRMMGGGFGGCTINLIHKDAVPKIKEKVSAHYYNKFNIQPQFYEVKISDGASLSLLTPSDDLV